MITQKDLFGIINAIKGVPKECVECVAFHQEGHISVPCRGDFDPCKCEVYRAGVAEGGSVKNTIDKMAEQEGGNYVDMDAADMGLSETPVVIPEDDAWPEWRTQVLGILRQEEGIRPGQIWRHFKGGIYRVLYLAKQSETGEDLVIYTKNGGDVTVWARPASMWLETVERDGKSQPRFELICNSPRENFCEDCHWYDDEYQYCFRQGNHSYDESSCELWEPKGEKE